MSLCQPPLFKYEGIAAPQTLIITLSERELAVSQSNHPYKYIQMETHEEAKFVKLLP